MERYICLDCRHIFEAKKDTKHLAKPRQCGKCWSYFVVSYEEYQKCKRRAMELIETTPLGVIPLWDVVQAVFLEGGIRLAPRKTLKLCDNLWREIKKEKRWI